MEEIYERHTKMFTHTDVSYMLLRFTKNDALAYFGKMYMDFFESTIEFLDEQLDECDTRKFCWRTYYKNLYQENVKVPEDITKLIMFLEWYKNPSRNDWQEQNHELTTKLISTDDLTFLTEHLDYNSLAYAQKKGFVYTAADIDITMGYNEDYWIQSSNLHNCPYPVENDNDELTLQLDENGWIDMSREHCDGFTTMREILNYQFSEFIENELELCDNNNNTVSIPLSTNVREWIFKENHLWSEYYDEVFFDRYETDRDLRNEMIDTTILINENKQSVFHYLMDEPLINHEGASKKLMNKMKGQHILDKRDIIKRGTYLLKAFDNNIVEKGTDWIEGMLNLEGAFYTETLSEAALIIQRAWVNARFNCEYKICRKYINKEIDELGEEIGLVLAD